MKETLRALIGDVVKNISLNSDTSFVIEHPDDISHGDYSTNVALILGKTLKKNPLTLAIEIAAKIDEALKDDANLRRDIEKVEVAGIGFINFYMTPAFFTSKLKEIVEKGDEYGKGDSYSGKKVAIEYTDPNPFKQFHIGHLMTNIIGESIAGLFEWNGAEVRRFCYQGDVGRHVALTIWALRFMDKSLPEENAPLTEKTKFLGEAYAIGSKKIAEDPTREAEVQKINKLIYDRSDPEVNAVYDKGREWSLEHFEELYEILGTKFDRYFFESEVWKLGVKIVRENTPKIFRESEGAVIFPGEEYGLHTRVFITKEDLPLYEAKDLGLAKSKYDAYKFDESWIMTGNEQNDYFKVVIKALSLLFPEIAPKYFHLSHGMLRFANGKMSSRTGDVITGESLIEDMIEAVHEKMKDRDLPIEEKQAIAEEVAVGAIKYAILKQSIGKDIVFDRERSLSFDGDSGPYLQYARTRAESVLAKALNENIKQECGFVDDELTKKLYRFPETIEEALELRAPHLVATYLTEMASLFNRFYAEQTIVDSKNAESKARVALVSAFSIVMRNGLKVLGIPVPEKM